MPWEIFWASAFISSLVIRLCADGLHLRLYVKRGQPRIFFLRHIRKTQGVHIHHFVFGLVIFLIAFALLAQDYDNTGMLFGGIGIALIASETKELVFSKWGY
jgi:hypothetical protein